ncbi:hypothetical protein ACLUUI_04675 [Enterobacterales bacterium AW_CKDN230030176-1A_HGKHYDSX7]
MAYLHRGANDNQRADIDKHYATVKTVATDLWGACPRWRPVRHHLHRGQARSHTDRVGLSDQRCSPNTHGHAAVKTVVTGLCGSGLARDGVRLVIACIAGKPALTYGLPLIFLNIDDVMGLV